MRAAIIGVGFMGWIHYLAYQRSSKATLAGFSSRNPAKRSGDWTSIQGNFGPPGERISVEDLVVFNNLEEALADPSIDLIDLCLPPDQHVDAVKQTLAAGKYCLCEKPLALTGKAAQELVELDTENRLMVAHVLTAMNEFKFLLDAKRGQTYGNLVCGRFNRTIGPPDWVPDFYNTAKVGGPLVDLHVHDAHLIRLLFGMPESVSTSSVRKDSVPKRYESVFDYGGRYVVSVGGGVDDSPARPFTHGYEVAFEKATVRFEYAGYADGTSDLIPLTVLHHDGRIERPDLGEADPIDAFVREIDWAADWIAGQPTEELQASIAADALTICHMQA